MSNIIKKILSEINFDDIETKTQLENNETNFSDKEITEFQKHSLDKIKIMLSEKYLSGDQSSLSLENNEGGKSMKNQTKVLNQIQVMNQMKNQIRVMNQKLSQ